MKKIQNGIVINKGAADAKSAEKDNVAGTEAGSAPKTAETTTVTAKAGAATVTTTTASSAPAAKPEEKKADVVVRKDGDGLFITAGAGGDGGDAIVSVNTGAVDINA